MDRSPGELVEDRDGAALVLSDPTPDAPVDPAQSITPASGSGAVVRWLRRGGRPWWSTPAMVVLGVLAGVLYFHQLSSNAMSNTFYAAAVKSGTESWKAFFFGSLDQSSFITVDKPPASLWLMALSGRIFGFSSLSMLAPIALAGASCVVVLYHVVRRWVGDVAAVLAAAALAVTPVFTAVFRSNEPDAVMTLFLVLAAWALWSALETGATSRLVLCGSLLGMAFLTKDLEAFVVLPAFVVVYLVFGPPNLGRRLLQLVWGLLALVVASAWWVAIVELWPAAGRPYVDNSGDNSEISLIFGYNGFGRLFGTSSPFHVPAATSRAGQRVSNTIASLTHFGSQPGWRRMFAPALGSQISWLIPVAALGVLSGLWATRRAPRSDRTRAGFVFWGLWAVCAIVVLSFVQGTFHTYYVVEIAPAVAALAGGGAVVMWRLGRSALRYAWLLPLGVVGSTLWAAHLLDRAPGYVRTLPRVVEVVGVIGAVVLLIVLVSIRRAPRLALSAAVVGGLAAAVAVLAGPTAYSLYTVQHPQTPTNPTGGPPATGTAPGLPSRFDTPALTRVLARLDEETEAQTRANGGVPPVPGVSPGLTRFLASHRDGARWIAAVGGSTTAAPLILITDEPVMAMGGFIGSEPVPTLAEFERLAAEGEVRYVVVNGGLGGFGGFGGFGAPRGRAGGIGGFGPFGRARVSGTDAGGAAVDLWAIQHGVHVPADVYGDPGTGGPLYYVGPRSGSPVPG